MVAVSDDGGFALVTVDKRNRGSECDYGEYLVIPTNFLISEEEWLFRTFRRGIMMKKDTVILSGRRTAVQECLSRGITFVR